ncbi:hypothetical protein [Rhizobium phage RHph_X2_26]|nr:hypothetical protein [Rhizobium phage RHph_X2_26]
MRNLEFFVIAVVLAAAFTVGLLRYESNMEEIARQNQEQIDWRKG